MRTAQLIKAASAHDDTSQIVTKEEQEESPSAKATQPSPKATAGRLEDWEGNDEGEDGEDDDDEDEE